MNHSSMFTSKISVFPEYQQQSGQQKKFDISFNTYLHPINVPSTQTTTMFANNPFQRTFASVVSCKPPIHPKSNDNSGKKGLLNTNKDGILNTFLKKIVYQQKSTMLPTKLPVFEHSHCQKEFEDFKTLPSYLQNQRTVPKPSSQSMHNSKHKHEKHRHNLEHDIRVDCDIFNIKKVNNSPTNHIKQTNMMKLNTDNNNLPKKNLDNPPFEIYSLEEFPAIPATTTSHDQKNNNMTAKCSQKADESDESDYVQYQDDIAKVTPTFIPRRYNLCEKVTNIVKSPKKLLNIPIMSPRRSCLKPTPRHRTVSECSDDFIVFDRSCCDEGITKDSTEIDFDDETESECSDEEDDDGVINDESDEEDLECEDYCDGINTIDENSPETMSNDTQIDSHQPDSGMEERKVHFNLVPKVHVIIAWDHAYRQARRGDEWRQYAVDRERFANRISKVGEKINPILDKCHRNRIFEDRFQQ